MMVHILWPVIRRRSLMVKPQHRKFIYICRNKSPKRWQNFKIFEILIKDFCRCFVSFYQKSNFRTKWKNYFWCINLNCYFRVACDKNSTITQRAFTDDCLNDFMDILIIIEHTLVRCLWLNCRFTCSSKWNENIAAKMFACSFWPGGVEFSIR